ncbi:YceI family protein [Rugosimonospora acidiphila]|uniref:YceI family protein n=1 Tax=Rugosimonospora acidiphila TaxID=556531 RepID=A0ABP9SD98_9ACTN
MTTELISRLLQSDTAVGSWTLDPARTTVRISHKTLWGMATVKGAFADVRGAGELGSDHSVTGTITVGAASIDTKNATRDTHLRSARFLDVERYPDIVVTVKSARTTGEAIELSGELTIKGVREPVTLIVEITALARTTLAAHVTGRVDRHRFGVSGNQLGMIIGPATIDVDAVFTRA